MRRARYRNEKRACQCAEIGWWERLIDLGRELSNNVSFALLCTNFASNRTTISPDVVVESIRASMWYIMSLQPVVSCVVHGSTAALHERDCLMRTDERTPPSFFPAENLWAAVSLFLDSDLRLSEMLCFALLPFVLQVRYLQFLTAPGLPSCP